MFQGYIKAAHSLKCSKCQNTYSNQSNFNRHKATCCRCSKCRNRFDSVLELANHSCEPPPKKARQDAESNRQKAVPTVCRAVRYSPPTQPQIMQLTSIQPSSAVEENQSAARRIPPLAVAVEDQTPAEEKIPASEVEECHPIPVRNRKSLEIKRPQSTKRNWRELEVQENTIIGRRCRISDLHAILLEFNSHFHLSRYSAKCV